MDTWCLPDLPLMNAMDKRHVFARCAKTMWRRAKHEQKIDLVVRDGEADMKSRSGDELERSSQVGGKPRVTNLADNQECAMFITTNRSTEKHCSATTSETRAAKEAAGSLLQCHHKRVRRRHLRKVLFLHLSHASAPTPPSWMDLHDCRCLSPSACVRVLCVSDGAWENPCALRRAEQEVVMCTPKIVTHRCHM